MSLTKAKVNVRITNKAKEFCEVTITSEKGAKPAINATGWCYVGKDWPEISVDIPASSMEVFFYDDKVPKGMTGFQLGFDKPKNFPTQVSVAYFTGKPNVDNNIAGGKSERKTADGPLDKVPLVDVMGYAIWN